VTDWATLWPVYLTSIGQTLWMVVATLVLGGVLGLALGVLLYTTRQGGLLENRVLSAVLNVLVNFVRPIPFIIFMTAVAPLTQAVLGTFLGTFVFSLTAIAELGEPRDSSGPVLVCTRNGVA